MILGFIGCFNTAIFLMLYVNVVITEHTCHINKGCELRPGYRDSIDHSSYHTDSCNYQEHGETLNLSIQNKRWPMLFSNVDSGIYLLRFWNAGDWRRKARILVELCDE